VRRKRRGKGAYSVGGYGPDALNGHYNEVSQYKMRT